MKAQTFSGGIHPSVKQNWKPITSAESLRFFAASNVAIPMRQHIGRICTPCVNKGDDVLLGQIIGEPQTPRDVPIHSSVSGKVLTVEERPHAVAGRMLAVIIENDGQDKMIDSIKPRSIDEVESLTAEQLREIIRDAGIVGMGGAEFPTHLKLNVNGRVEFLIINGSECEPSLTGDHRRMIENAQEVVNGALLMARACNAEQCVIGIEGKPDAVEAISKAIVDHGKIRVQALEEKYPQGSEKMLIDAITKREVPAGGLPSAVGCVVCNVSSAVATAEAVYSGKPLFERIVTVTGGVIKPGNLMLRIGTLFADAVDFCGGFVSEPQKIVSGGPMMGFAVSGLNVPITKGSGGITVFTKADKPMIEQGNCLRCGRCVAACPCRLMPQSINMAYLANRLDLCKDLRADLCMKCGCCSFVCPAKRHLTQTIDLAKNELAALARR